MRLTTLRHTFFIALALAKLGHQVAPYGELDWRAGAVCAIRVNDKTGLLEGGADPRRPCYALGV